MFERSVARSEEDSFALLGTGFAISYKRIANGEWRQKSEVERGYLPKPFLITKN
jgi:hypothetical protein